MTYYSYDHAPSSLSNPNSNPNTKKRKHIDHDVYDVAAENKRSKPHDNAYSAHTTPYYVLPPRHRKRHQNHNNQIQYALYPQQQQQPQHAPHHQHHNHPNNHQNNHIDYEYSSSTSPNPIIDPHNKQNTFNCIDPNEYNGYNECIYNGYNIYDGEYFVSIDVECGATGYGHFDSAPVRIAMVDFYGNILFDRICSIPNLVDPLTEFTGLNQYEIETHGSSLSSVLSSFHEILSGYNKLYKYGVVLVGQSVIMDIIWTKLLHNVHYSRIIDIAHQFRTKSEIWSNYQYYSLRQCAWALLQCDMNLQYHDPAEDARVSMTLYREFCLDQNILNAAKQKLIYMKRKHEFPNFKVYTKFRQCCAMYCPSKCFCGQKTAVHLNKDQYIDAEIEELRKLFRDSSKHPVKHI